jgi:pimeloyl-ACP methyl ester carboxylesterase
VPCLARFPILFSALTIFAAIPLAAIPLRAADGATVVMPQTAPSSIVVGFVGGFVRHDNPHHGPVLLAERLQREAPKGTYVRVFENRRRKTAYKTILRLLDRDHDGTLSEEEKAQARIVLFGHSWGASAAVLLARELSRVGIPVLLTVQVDSVAKFWQHDGVIPENVAAAVNFYQPHGLVHGRAEISAADPGKTQILGNYRIDYKQEPVKCEGLSWYDRLVTPSHAESECDPHLWTQVENLVRQRLQPEAGIVAANPGP